MHCQSTERKKLSVWSYKALQTQPSYTTIFRGIFSFTHTVCREKAGLVRTKFKSNSKRRHCTYTKIWKLHIGGGGGGQLPPHSRIRLILAGATTTAIVTREAVCAIHLEIASVPSRPIILGQQNFREVRRNHKSDPKVHLSIMWRREDEFRAVNLMGEEEGEGMQRQPTRQRVNKTSFRRYRMFG